MNDDAVLYVCFCPYLGSKSPSLNCSFPTRSLKWSYMLPPKILMDGFRTCRDCNCPGHGVIYAVSKTKKVFCSEQMLSAALLQYLLRACTCLLCSCRWDVWLGWTVGRKAGRYWGESEQTMWCELVMRATLLSPKSSHKLNPISLFSKDFFFCLICINTSIIALLISSSTKL